MKTHKQSDCSTNLGVSFGSPSDCSKECDKVWSDIQRDIERDINCPQRCRLDSKGCSAGVLQ